MTTAEAALKADHDELIKHLLDTQPSLATSAGAVLTKALVLAGASEMEVDFQSHIVAYYREIAGESGRHAADFVEKKAVKRQFHTYFNWDQPSANPFFGLFGAAFSTVLKERVRKDEGFAEAVRSFLELGQMRNEIVHQNFAAYSLSKTADEVHQLCEAARVFVDEIPTLLRGSYE